MQPDNKTLAVPVIVEAWVVNKAVLSAQVDHPERTVGGRVLPSYRSLSNFRSPIRNAQREKPADIKQGVYLHWTLPHGLRHKKVDSEFPPVPNRWVVVRYYGPPLERQATAWVIESDYMTQDTKETAGSPFSNPIQPGQVYLGRATPLEKWKELTTPRKADPSFLPKLDAVSNGDVYFSMYQPSCQNVFSFVDTEIATDSKLNQNDLSYFVAGWFTDCSGLINLDTLIG